MALVVRRPLPYVYLAREVFRSAGIPSQMFDALPLASEPYAAALDLVIGFVRGNCGRGPAIALLRSPHFHFGPDDTALAPREIAALDRALGDAGYLGDIDALERLMATWREARLGSRQQALRAAEAVAELKGGDGLGEGISQGPLIDMAAVEKVEEHIADALGKGAKVVAGGSRHELGGQFFQPTILADVTSDMKVAHEETFGPVAPLFRFDTEEEAIQMANNTEFGLASYFFSRDIGRIWRVAEALEYGMVGINEGILSTEVAPFGGVKESGIGREGARQGLDDFMEVKYLCMGSLNT